MTALVVLAVIGGWLYVCYASTVKARNRLDEALSGIDVQLKKRADLIPNVLTVAQKFMTHEKAIFQEVTRLRTQALAAPIGSGERFKAEAALEGKMKQLTLSAENYPDLKSDKTMTAAIASYNDVEENIAASRRFYNTALRQLNDKVRVFPSSLFKSFAGDLSGLDYFEAAEEEKKPIKAADYLK